MGKYTRFVQVCVIAMGCVLYTATAHGFDFNPKGPQITLVTVPEDVVGDVWAVAVTESWQETKNTVWAHCMDVLVSYEAPKTDVERCEKDVALVNDATLEDLKTLQVGQLITLPLTRAIANEHVRVDGQTAKVDELIETPTQQSARAEEAQSGSVKDLRDQVALLEAEVGAVYAESRQQGRRENERFEALTAQLTALSETVQQLVSSRQTGLTDALPVRASIQNEGGHVVFADHVRSLLLHSVWGPIIFLGAGLIVLIIIGGNVWNGARWRKLRQELKTKDRELLRYRLEFRKDDALLSRLEKDIVRLENELNDAQQHFDFNEQLYEFDGKKYPIKLKAVTEAGKVYTTPTAEAVLEKNLKSHFSHALKAGQRKAA
jgi:hypothetical protein